MVRQTKIDNHKLDIAFSTTNMTKDCNLTSRRELYRFAITAAVKSLVVALPRCMKIFRYKKKTKDQTRTERTYHPSRES